MIKYFKYAEDVTISAFIYSKSASSIMKQFFLSEYITKFNNTNELP